MSRESTVRGHADPDDPDAIRAAMADTRAALGRKLGALRERVLGPAPAAPNQGDQAMPVKKKATKSAKKSGAAAKGKKKAAPAKKAASRKSAAKRKTAVARVTAKAKPKKAAKPAAKKKPAASSMASKAKEILIGAAAGAMKGAAETMAPTPAPAPMTPPPPPPAEPQPYTWTNP